MKKKPESEFESVEPDTIAQAEAEHAAAKHAPALPVQAPPVDLDAPARLNPQGTPAGYVPLAYPLVVRKGADEKLVNDEAAHDAAKADGWA